MHELLATIFSFFERIKAARSKFTDGQILPIAQRQNPATMKLVWPYDDIDETWTIASS